MTLVALPDSEKERKLQQNLNLLWESLGERNSAIKKYEQSLYAMLNLCYATEQDILIDIITDTLNGFALMEKHESDAVKGKELFEEKFKS